MRGSSLRRLGAACSEATSILGLATAMPLFAPTQLYCARLFPIVPYHGVLRRLVVFLLAPQPLYRGVSWRQRTAAAELAMPGCRAPPGVSIEKLAAPPTSTSIPPFLHLAADMARQEPRSRCSREEAGEDKVF